MRFLCLVPVLASAGAACAQPLIDNLAEPMRAATILGSADPDLIWAAQSFASPTRYALVSIETIAGNAIGGAGGPDAVIELRAGKDPSGPALATFAIPALLDAGLDVVTLIPDVGVTIEPDATYWLVMGVISTGSFEWAYAEGNNFSGPGFFHGYSYSYDLGVSWSSFGGDNPYYLRVNVSSVCAADFNQDALVNSQDFFDFLSAFFAEDPGADFNLDAFINSQDFFDFLTAFFAGC